MPINSKAKGSSFELKLAKMLTTWAGETFHRTPGSGALHWANDKRVVSDIVPSAILMAKGWQFSIEAKNVEYTWEFSNLLEGTSLFWTHWNQCIADAQREGMVPLLVFKKNRRDIYTAMLTKTFNELEIQPLRVINIHALGYDLTILRFTDLLESITCEELLQKTLSRP